MKNLRKKGSGGTKTCKDCIHFDVCAVKKNYYANKPFKNGNIDKEQLKYINGVEETCKHFKDKSRFIELPCKVGDITISKNKNEQIELTSKYFDFRV